MTAAEIRVTKEKIDHYQHLINSRPELKFFRCNDKFLVLKNTIDQELIGFMNYLDLKCGWSIRRMYNPNGVYYPADDNLVPLELSRRSLDCENKGKTNTVDAKDGAQKDDSDKGN